MKKARSSRESEGGDRMKMWWLKYRLFVKSVMFPLICVQFVRTLIFPNPFDVLLLFALFLGYLGFLLNWY
jgi:hypothetical protein